MLVDSHAHLDFVEDLDGILKRAKESQINKIITIGTSIEASKKCIEIADSISQKLRETKENFPEIYATCGIHPEDGKGDKGDLDKFGGDYIQELEKVAGSSKKVVAIGECGLDYHLGSDRRPVTSDEEKEFQKELFKAQIKLAGELNLPLVVHCRNAWEEIFSLLTTDYGLHTRPRGVFHSWTGNIEAARKAFDLGFYISFSGIVTFKNAKDIQEAANIVPLNRMLVETDSPFLAPEPARGSRNEPKNVKIIADFLAELRSVSYEEIYVATCSNAKKLFGLE